MMQWNSASLASLAFWVGHSTCHMIMANPVPFSVDSLNNSPLVDAKPGTAQSDYPCKIRSDMWKVDHMNSMTVDEPQMLNFSGSASHGGGTCQIAITLDKEPDHTSTFKVIQVFEGGCPTSADGNGGSHPFSFSVPKGFPNGQATLAWVWYNKIGNREVYMNCAPIEVSGGSNTHDVYNALPNLYLINLPTSECSTVETSDQIVPFPGQYVLKDSSALSAATGPSCAASASAQTSGVQGYQSAVSSDGGAYSAPANGGAGGSAGQSATAPASSAAQPTSAAVSYSSAQVTLPSIVTISTPPASSGAGYPTMSVSSNAGVFGPATTASSAAAPVGTGGSVGGSCSGDAMLCNSDGAQFGL